MNDNPRPNDKPPYASGQLVRPMCKSIEPFTVEACEKHVIHGRTKWVVYGSGDVRYFADTVELAPANSPEKPDGSLGDLASQLAAVTAERDHANLFARTVLSSLRWTGDGYEWTGGRFDYRMEPSEAAALTTSEIERLRSEAKEHAAERHLLMTALDGLLNDFIKAVPSSEPIDCNKFTRYQPALLAYVTVRDKRKHGIEKANGAA